MRDNYYGERRNCEGYSDPTYADGTRSIRSAEKQLLRALEQNKELKRQLADAKTENADMRRRLRRIVNMAAGRE